MEQTYNQYLQVERDKQTEWEPSIKVRPPLPGEYVQRYINFSMCFAEHNPREGRGLEDG